jgi:sugar lactone lactonase YvrE
MKRLAVTATLLAALGAAQPAAAQVGGYEKAWKTKGFSVPEGVVYAPRLDAFVVSNIAGGAPLEQDGDGFLSRLSLDGEIVDLRFVEGLDAPKGMAIVGSTLYVSDVDELVEVDLDAGEVTERHAVDGARFLNDVTIGPEGAVYVSDMATGLIHVLRGGTVEVWSDDGRLTSDSGNVNGLLAEDGRLLAYVGDKLWAIDWEDQSYDLVAEGLGSGDGLVPDGNGGYVLTNWVGRIFHLDGQGAIATLSDTRLLGVNSADPGVAPDGTVTVPTFFDDAVWAIRPVTE